MPQIFSVFAVFALGLILNSQALANTDDWKIVPHKEVCMVTNAHFSRPQIPVEQAGKTYYGCCENCKTTLQNDPSSRVATDPVSKKDVDKAVATIAADKNGNILYFENKANFEKFIAAKP